MGKCDMTTTTAAARKHALGQADITVSTLMVIVGIQTHALDIPAAPALRNAPNTRLPMCPQTPATAQTAQLAIWHTETAIATAQPLWQFSCSAAHVRRDCAFAEGDGYVNVQMIKPQKNIGA